MCGRKVMHKAIDVDEVDCDCVCMYVVYEVLCWRDEVGSLYESFTKLITWTAKRAAYGPWRATPPFSDAKGSRYEGT